MEKKFKIDNDYDVSQHIEDKELDIMSKIKSLGQNNYNYVFIASRDVEKLEDARKQFVMASAHGDIKNMEALFYSLFKKLKHIQIPALISLLDNYDTNDKELNEILRSIMKTKLKQILKTIDNAQ